MPRKKHDPRRQARNFGLMLLPILLGLAGIAWWRGRERAAVIMGVLSVIPPILTFAAFPLWFRFFEAWMKFAEILSWVMTRVILSVFYFGFLTPIGFVMRLFREDPLNRNWKKRQPSYWIDKKPVAHSVERYEKQF